MLRALYNISCIGNMFLFMGDKMVISEVTADSILNVTATKGNMSVNLITTPAFTADGDLYAQPFLHDGNVVNFSVPGLAVELMAVKSGEIPVYFKSVSIAKTKYEGKVYHCISSDVLGVKLNRRNSFRVFVGERGEAMELTGGGRYDVTVKDVSSTGIAFVAKNADDSLFQSGDHVHIIFEDTTAYFKIDVVARVVRVLKIEAGVLFGCAFTRMYPQIDRYVAAKQMRNRNKSTTVKK